MSIVYRSPEVKKIAINKDTVSVFVECFGSGLRTFDVEEAVGFSVCGLDGVWHFAKGKIVGTSTIEVTCPDVPVPVAVRYAWANNPVCNVTNREGLPLTPFRSDNFELTTKPKTP
jgi:sialate O-acetylesterase